MFNAELLGFNSYDFPPHDTVAFEPIVKRARDETNDCLQEYRSFKTAAVECAPPPPPPPPSQLGQADGSIPQSLPVFVLPAGFFAEQPSSSSHAHDPVDHHADPRRRKFRKESKFPLSGLLREEGGVFGFLDRVSNLDK